MIFQLWQAKDKSLSAMIAKDVADPEKLSVGHDMVEEFEAPNYVEAEAHASSFFAAQKSGT